MKVGSLYMPLDSYKEWIQLQLFVYKFTMVLINNGAPYLSNQVVSKCKKLGAQEAMYIALDMGNPNHTLILLEEASLRFSGLDHLILNHLSHTPMEPWSSHQMENNLEQVSLL